MACGGRLGVLLSDQLTSRRSRRAADGARLSGRSVRLYTLVVVLQENKLTIFYGIFEKYLLLAVLLMVGLIVSLCSVTLSIVERRIHRESLKALGAIALLAMLFTTLPPYGWSEARQAQIVLQGFGLLESIEQYRRHYGVYPLSLEDAGIPVPNTLFGPFHYEPNNQSSATSYILRVGDYAKNGFESWWDSQQPKKGWQVDT